MVRPHKCRLIDAEPGFTLFKPAGVPAHELDVIELPLDELEALRLADFEGLYHEAAAERMGVSRATFGRLVAAGRAKTAQALIHGKALAFSGGAVVVARLCVRCGRRCPRRRPHCPKCTNDRTPTE